MGDAVLSSADEEQKPVKEDVSSSSIADSDQLPDRLDANPKEEPQREPMKTTKILLLIIAALYTALYVGAFFGWGPMQLLLEENGSFQSKCTDDEQAQKKVCPAQTSALLNVQFYAQVTQIMSPLLGEIIDRYGPAVLSYLMAACSWSGLALLIVAAEQVDGLLYPAFILISFATWMGGLLTVRTGMVFDGKLQGRVIFALNSLFDAGSTTYLGLWGISESSGASLSVVATSYLVGSIVLFGGAACLWTLVVRGEISTGEEISTAGKPRLEEVSAPRSQSAPETTSNANAIVSSSIVTVDGEASRDTPALNEEASGSSRQSYILIADRTTRRQIMSGPFFLVTVFWCIMVTANQFTLTTTRDFLAHLGDDEVGNKYLTIFTLLTPASLCALPFSDYMVARFGFHGGFQSVNALALGYNLVRLLSDSLNVQVLGFILFSFFRCFLFGVSFSFLPTLLSPQVVGKAAGILYAITGVTSYINIPLSTLAVKGQDGDFFIPTLIYTLLIIPSVVASWGIGRVIKMEDKVKASKNGTSTEPDN